MSPKNLRRLSIAVTAVVVALILVGTLSPQGSPTATTFGLGSRLAHFILFFVLGFGAAPLFATSAAARRSPRRALLMTLLLFWIFAALTEIAQGAVDGRESSFADWGADIAGAVTGFLAGSVILRWIVDRPRQDRTGR